MLKVPVCKNCIHRNVCKYERILGYERLQVTLNNEFYAYQQTLSNTDFNIDIKCNFKQEQGDSKRSKG